MECDIPPALSCAYRGLVCWQCVSVAQRSYHGLGFDGKCDRGFGFWGVCDTPQEWSLTIVIWVYGDMPLALSFAYRNTL